MLSALIVSPSGFGFGERCLRDLNVCIVDACVGMDVDVGVVVDVGMCVEIGVDMGVGMNFPSLFF